jgi:hypothetical protein
MAPRRRGGVYEDRGEAPLVQPVVQGDELRSLELLLDPSSSVGGGFPAFSTASPDPSPSSELVQRADPTYCSMFTTFMMSCVEGTIPTSWRTGIRNLPKAS